MTLIFNIVYFFTFHTFQLYKEPFRIKQLTTGNCWAPDSNLEKIKATSSCRDVFQLLDNSKLEHVNSQTRVFFNGNTNEATLTSNAGNSFILSNNTIVEQREYGNQYCYTEQDEKIQINGSFEIGTRFCDSDSASHVKILTGITKIHRDNLYILFFIIFSTFKLSSTSKSFRGFCIGLALRSHAPINFA